MTEEATGASTVLVQHSCTRVRIGLSELGTEHKMSDRQLEYAVSSW